MSKLDSLLEKRIDNAPSAKVKALAQQSAEGALSSFNGLFRTQELSKTEKRALEAILLNYKKESHDIAEDLFQLESLTSEVKAIHNQAALLHGERIKKAQELLKAYKEGAFTSWLYAAYGNRQTPYNFLLYFEFVQTLSHPLKQKVDRMPRQAIYALASRKVGLQHKHTFVESFQGESKKELLERIRTSFPLEIEDKRRSSPEAPIIASLEHLLTSYHRQANTITPAGKESIKRTLRLFLRSLD